MTRLKRGDCCWEFPSVRRWLWRMVQLTSSGWQHFDPVSSRFVRYRNLLSGSAIRLIWRETQPLPFIRARQSCAAQYDPFLPLHSGGILSLELHSHHPAFSGPCIGRPPALGREAVPLAVETCATRSRHTHPRHAARQRAIRPNGPIAFIG